MSKTGKVIENLAIKLVLFKKLPLNLHFHHFKMQTFLNEIESAKEWFFSYADLIELSCFRIHKLHAKFATLTGPKGAAGTLISGLGAENRAQVFFSIQGLLYFSFKHQEPDFKCVKNRVNEAFVRCYSRKEVIGKILGLLEGLTAEIEALTRS